jgi:hypothetical protein
MRCFHFGALREGPPLLLASRRGQRNLVGEIALHVQCPWRLDMEGSIITGLTDLWSRSPGSQTLDDDEWDWDKHGCLQDHLIDKFFMSNREIIVTSVSVDVAGSFTVTMSQSVVLRVFVAGCHGEDWRLFNIHNEDPHFVVSQGVVEAPDDAA